MNNDTQTTIEHDDIDNNESQKKTSSGTSGAAAAFIFLAIILSLSATGGSFLLFQTLEKNRAEFSQQMEHTRNELSAVSIKVNGSVNSQLGTVTKTLSSITAEQQQFQQTATAQQQTTEALAKKLSISNQQMLQSIDVLFKQKGRERIGWVLAEVDYLLLIANHSLQLEKNVATAIAALEAADSRLLDTGDPGTIKARTQINDEIQQLKALKQPDIVCMAARLGSVIKNTPTLPILFTQMNTKKKIADLVDKKASHDSADLEQAGKDFLHELRNLVVFRELEESPKALMTPKEQFFLQQNLQLKLETARRALLLGQRQLFSDSLGEAITWLKEFFDPSSTQVQHSIEELSQLQGKTITSEMPNIAHSLKLVRAYQHELEQQQEVK